jgi:hypothetical protein
MIDLNNLIPAGSPWFLAEVDSINSRGQIVGGALNTITGEVHAVLATPCDEGNVDDLGCSDNYTAIGLADSGERPNVVLPLDVRKMLRPRLGSRYHLPGLEASEQN